MHKIQEYQHSVQPQAATASNKNVAQPSSATEIHFTGKFDPAKEG